jgi:hypothetical protein
LIHQIVEAASTKAAVTVGVNVPLTFGKETDITKTRALIDDFLIQYCQNLGKRDFMFKAEIMSTQKRGKREYLNNDETKARALFHREVEQLF